MNIFESPSATTKAMAELLNKATKNPKQANIVVVGSVNMPKFYDFIDANRFDSVHIATCPRDSELSLYSELPEVTFVINDMDDNGQCDILAVQEFIRIHNVTRPFITMLSAFRYTSTWLSENPQVLHLVFQGNDGKFYVATLIKSHEDEDSYM